MAIQLPWVNTAPITVALSPLLSPWIHVELGVFTKVLPVFLFVAGTSVHTIEWSLDGINAEAVSPFAPSTPVSGTAFVVVAPFLRWKTVQTVADATTSKIYLQPLLL